MAAAGRFFFQRLVDHLGPGDPVDDDQCQRPGPVHLGDNLGEPGGVLERLFSILGCERQPAGVEWLGCLQPRRQLRAVAVVQLQYLCALHQWCGVNGVKPSGVHRGGQPHRMRGAVRPVLKAKGLQLSGGCQGIAKQLGFVDDPQRVIVEQSEVHRPAVPAHAIASVESPGEQLILGADEDLMSLRVDLPSCGALPAHQDVQGQSLRHPKAGQPSPGRIVRLLHQRSLRQAINQAPGRGLANLLGPVQGAPEPGEDGRCRLACSRRDADNPRPIRRGCQPPLVVVRCESGSALKQRIELRSWSLLSMIFDISDYNEGGDTDCQPCQGWPRCFPAAPSPAITRNHHPRHKPSAFPVSGGRRAAGGRRGGGLPRPAQTGGASARIPGSRGRGPSPASDHRRR